jgi:hypothetical protein
MFPVKIQRIFNIPRFFETVIQYDTFEEILDDNTTVIIESIGYDVTPLRKNPDYIRYEIFSQSEIWFNFNTVTFYFFHFRFYINWTRFLCTGLFPIIGLVFFKFNIFRGIRSIERKVTELPHIFNVPGSLIQDPATLFKMRSIWLSS